MMTLDREIDPRDVEPDELDRQPRPEDDGEPAVGVEGDVPLEVGEGDWLESRIGPSDDESDEREHGD